MYKETSPLPCNRQLPPGDRTGGRAGFSFIEVLISVALLSFLLVGVLAMNSAYIKYNSINKHYATAVQQAENGVETFLRLPYTSLNGRTQTLGYGQIPGFPNYVRQVTVEDYNAITCTIRSRTAWWAGSGPKVVPGARWPIEISVTRTSL